MKLTRILVALAVVAALGGVLGGLTVERVSHRAAVCTGTDCAPELVQVARFKVEDDAEANFFYSPNPAAMGIGPGVCINNMNANDGGSPVCLYTITTNGAGDLAFTCNHAGGASCYVNLAQLVAGTGSIAQNIVLCDGGPCQGSDAGTVGVNTY